MSEHRKPYTPPSIREITDPAERERVHKALASAVDQDIAFAILKLLDERHANPMNSFSALGALAVGFARGFKVPREAFLEMMANAFDASMRIGRPS